mmetsp:Transcript_14436/g.19303  ORF Transcript_14436/g.19303 Transcript_14436/m.19303 type:complete len:418 (+) Transcript_14436:20-1273(+)
MMELPKKGFKYGTVPTREDVENPSERKQRIRNLRASKSLESVGGRSFKVESYSAYNRPKGLVSHAWSRTSAADEVELPHHTDMYEILARWAGLSEHNIKNEENPLKESILIRLRPSSSEGFRRYVDQCTNWSIVVNILLTIVKLWSAYVSGSLAVLASLVDSFLDLAQTFVLFVVEKKASLPPDTEYPAGRKRLEPVGVLVCAVLMGLGSFFVIFDSCKTLAEAFESGKSPTLSIDAITLLILVITVLSKAILWLFCKAVSEQSSTALALAEDHSNDVLSNFVAIIAAGLASWHAQLWWTDPIGAIIISIYIIRAWILIGSEHIEQIVGKGASDEQVKYIAALASAHDPDNYKLIGICAYHFGPAFLVQLDMCIANDNTPVSAVYDTEMKLAAIIEELDWVERCFVSVCKKEDSTPL